jgi:hypothetical protein
MQFMCVEIFGAEWVSDGSGILGSNNSSSSIGSKKRWFTFINMKMGNTQLKIKST